MKIIGLFDKVANKFVSTTMCESEQMFIRDSLFAICMDYPIKDVDFYVLGDFDEELGIIKPCSPRKCSWESYKFPETRMSKEKYLTIEQIEEAAKNKKHEFLKKTKDNIKDLENALIQAKGALHKEEHSEKPNKKRVKELKNIINNISTQIYKAKEVVNG